jgi:hypothetical protein
MVLPTTEQVGVQLPGKYVTPVGRTSFNWTPVAVLVADALFW